jgi:hypothetical protein
MTTEVRTTVIRYHSQRPLAQPRLMDHQIQLNAGGEGWMGTFGVMVRALLNDILEDGAPVPDVTLVVWREGEIAEYAAITGDVAVAGPRLVIFADGTQVEIEHILSVTV